jgi:hypothetical protein
MAKQQLFTIATLAYKMWEMMDKGEELEDWMESKIAQSEQSITSVVKAYLYEDYEDESKGMGGLDYDELIICGHIFSETTQNIAVILHLLSRLSKIYVYENYKYGLLSDITEHTLKYDIKVPYIGCLLKYFNYTGDIIEFGKITYKDLNFGIMIGDSEEMDGKCCEKNNGLFIHILSDESPLRYMTNHYTVGNIDILYDSIINLIESNK